MYRVVAKLPRGCYLDLPTATFATRREAEVERRTLCLDLLEMGYADMDITLARSVITVEPA